jgi:hypothetical protein
MHVHVYCPAAIGYRKHDISLVSFPRLQIRLPLIYGRTISRDDPDVVSFHICSEENVES